MARMIERQVIGFRRVDYTKKTGGEVHGCEVYLQLIEPDPGTEGVQVEVCWLSDAYSSYKPALCDIVRKTYNRWGNVEDLICC